jgi:hypothetical protein
MQYQFVTDAGAKLASASIPADLRAGDVVAFGGREWVVLDQPARWERLPLILGEAWVRRVTVAPAAGGEPGQAAA